MTRDTLGGFPFEVKKENGMTILRFFPKKTLAEFPNDAELTLRLGPQDVSKLRAILAQS